MNHSLPSLSEGGPHGRGPLRVGTHLDRLLALAVDLSDTASLFAQRAWDSGDHMLYAEATARQREVRQVIQALDEEVTE